MYDLSAPDIDCHMAGVTYQIARTKLLCADCRAAVYLGTGVMRKGNPCYITIHTHRKSGAVYLSADGKVRAGPYIIALSNPLERIIYNLRTVIPA